MIEVRNAHKALGEFSLRGVDLRVESGEYFVILGPTGAGKTVLLECIAGLHKMEAGEVWLEGENVTALLPEQRNIGYVPQDYVLFPHLSLRENIAFSLSVKRSPPKLIEERVQSLTEMLGITHLLERRPRTLSGGEQQRGAMARALGPQPTVLLLDEPLSALDEGTRADLSVELAKISRDMGTTVIHVCHNFDEALELADRIAIMRHGLIVQTGTPAEVFRKPCNEFVAHFVGARNLFAVASVKEEAVELECGVRLAVTSAGEVKTEGGLLASVRPEEIALCRGAPSPGRGVNAVPCRLVRIQDRGRFVRLHLEGRMPLQSTMTPQAFAATGVAEGEEVTASFDADCVHLLPA